MYTKPGAKPIVIVQFNKRWLRNELLKRKTEIAVKSVSFSEHLTSHNMKMLKRAKSIAGPYYAFSQKGTVYARADDKKIPINSQEDLDELQKLVKV